MNKVKSKVITEESLRKSGLWYLEKYAASAHSLKQVLNRRVLKAMLVEDLDKDICNHWIDCIIERFTKAGLLNDSEFAQAKASSLFKKGTSTQMIRSKLFDKGISGAIIDQVVTELNESDEILNLKIAVGACSPVAQRLRLLEQEAVGQKLKSIKILPAHFESLEPIDDIRATADYRKKVVPELLLRAIKGVI